MVEPQTINFEDDGQIPNSHLPLLLYQGAFAIGTPDLVEVVQRRFEANGWTGAWTGSVFTYHHYHSTTHEVLGVCAGTATLRLGGERGQDVEVQTGDVIVIPAGVGHKRLESSPDFEVAGAYPDGRQWDLLRGGPGERPQADRNIASVPMPAKDPVFGSEGPLRRLWQR